MFDYFIPLGSACAVAASMSKNGLRSCSGPFDWLVTSDFSWVLYHIDTDFKDFLLRENVEPNRNFPDSNRFFDKQSDIQFLHEEESYIYEWDKLKSKYDRRIARFLDISKSKVCYLRSMRNVADVHYIETHADYIRRVIGKHNPDSEMVFLCDDDLPVPENFPFRYYKMKNKFSTACRYAMRSYFDGAYDFLDFCGENYSGTHLIRNFAIDIDKELPHAKLIERRYKTLTTLLAHDFQKDTFSDSVIIYGAGVIGIELYQRIKNYTKVKCFVDQKKAGEEFDHIKIISAEEIQYEPGTKIIVSAAYDFENIKKVLCSMYEEEAVISLDDILRLKF